MNFIENLEKKEYEEFVKNHPKSHFMQSYYWGEVMKHKNFTPHYVGIKKDGKLIATALLLKKHLLKNYCYFYAPRGYILDYDNLDVIEYFTKSLKEYGKKHHALFIKIDPDIKLHNLDLDGNVVGELNRMSLIDFLKKLGYRHMGFNKQFTGEQPRFTFRLNLDDDFNSIYGRIHPTTRKILNKGNQYNLDMYIGDETDIDDFYQTMIDTAEREHLKKTPISILLSFCLKFKVFLLIIYSSSLRFTLILFSANFVAFLIASLVPNFSFLTFVFLCFSILMINGIIFSFISTFLCSK